jgi:hypothetical protein
LSPGTGRAGANATSIVERVDIKKTFVDGDDV